MYSTIEFRESNKYTLMNLCLRVVNSTNSKNSFFRSHWCLKALRDWFRNVETIRFFGNIVIINIINPKWLSIRIKAGYKSFWLCATITEWFDIWLSSYKHIITGLGSKVVNCYLTCCSCSIINWVNWSQASRSCIKRGWVRDCISCLWNKTISYMWLEWLKSIWCIANQLECLWTNILFN